MLSCEIYQFIQPKKSFLDNSPVSQKLQLQTQPLNCSAIAMQLLPVHCHLKMLKFPRCHRQSEALRRHFKRSAPSFNDQSAIFNIFQKFYKSSPYIQTISVCVTMFKSSLILTLFFGLLLFRQGLALCINVVNLTITLLHDFCLFINSTIANSMSSVDQNLQNGTSTFLQTFLCQDFYQISQELYQNLCKIINCRCIKLFIDFFEYFFFVCSHIFCCSNYNIIIITLKCEELETLPQIKNLIN